LASGESACARTLRGIPKTGRGTRDVQLLADHKSIEITQGYIDGDTGRQRRLLASL
jgi:hypothetical protein